MWREELDDTGLGHHGDKTTTGAVCYSSMQDSYWFGMPALLRQGDRVGICPSCGQPGKIAEGTPRMSYGGLYVAFDKALVICGCPPGSNRLIARTGDWLGPGEPPHPYEPSHIVLARMNGETRAEPEQHAQAAKKKDKPAPLPLPAVIYQTKNRMDDYDAKDMHHGDLDVLALRNQFRLDVDTVSTKVNAYTLRLVNPLNPYGIPSPYAMPETQKQMPAVSREEAAALMFDEFRELAKLFSFQGPYRDVIMEMITHMQENTGTPYSSPLLDRALKEQILNDQSEQSSLLRIKKVISRYVNTEYSFYPLKDKEKFKDEIGNYSVLPKFDRNTDYTNGLVITVHDTWSTHITLESLEVNGDSYRAKVHYRIQDHFGLDDTDVLDPLYQKFRLFRLWFALQRWDLYGYKPFITEINATVEISGRRGE